MKSCFCSAAFVLGLGTSIVSADEPFGKNMFCGPRCVQRVLDSYGTSSDLIELIKSTQWPVPEDGSSFEALARVLNSRGVYTASVNLPPSARIDWNTPAIVQLKSGDARHYVVWLPPDEQNPARIWDGDQSPALTLTPFVNLRAGPVLLTSSQPITDEQWVANEAQFFIPFWVMCLLTAGAGIAIGVVAGATKKRSCP